jgi:hypothetical protein
LFIADRSEVATSAETPEARHSVMGREALWWGGCGWDSLALPDLLPNEPEVLGPDPRGRGRGRLAARDGRILGRLALKGGSNRGDAGVRGVSRGRESRRRCSAVESVLMGAPEPRLAAPHRRLRRLSRNTICESVSAVREHGSDTVPVPNQAQDEARFTADNRVRMGGPLSSEAHRGGLPTWEADTLPAELLPLGRSTF